MKLTHWIGACVVAVAAVLALELREPPAGSGAADTTVKSLLDSVWAAVRGALPGVRAVFLAALLLRRDLEQRDAQLLVSIGVACDAHDLSLVRLELPLLLVGRVRDLGLWIAGLERLHHAAHLVDVGDVPPRGLLGQVQTPFGLVGPVTFRAVLGQQRFDVAAEVDRPGRRRGDTFGR